MVRFELTPAAGGTELRLTHTRQSAAIARGTAGGWHAHLDMFEAHVRGESLAWDDAYPQAKALYASVVDSIA